MGYTPPQLEVRKITGGWQLFPPTLTSTDDLTILANGTDTYPYITLLGNSGLTIATKAGTTVSLQSEATLGLTMYYDSGGNQFRISSKVSNKDLYLETTGSGVLKVPGTATATGDVAINGHYDIKDSTGATIKLATVA